MTARFTEGATYNRRKDIHEHFGGQQQGGIITPAAEPFIFLITGEAGKTIGYQDEWLDGETFLYFGAGQEGDMEFIGRNKAIRDHAVNDEEIHLFEKSGREGIIYRGEFVCEGYEWRKALDRNGNERQAIAFRLKKSPLRNEQRVEEAEKKQEALSLEDLRKIASSGVQETGPKKGKPRTVYERSAAIKAYVKARAGGNCEGCQEEAPFLDRKGQPYLEPHHAKRLSDGGPDSPENVIALCPTCHRRVHSGQDGDSYNRTLIARIEELEKS